MVVTYAVTLSIFPGVLAEDTQSPALGSWYPLILLSVYNVADLVGKVVPFCGLGPSQQALLRASCARLAFVPAYLAAVRLFPGVVSVMATLTMALGFSNGLLSAMLLTLAPAHAPAETAELTEGVMVFALVLGLTVGAAAGFLWLL